MRSEDLQNPAKLHLEQYWTSLKPIERADFANRAVTSVGYIRNLLFIKEKAIGPELALRMEIASGEILKAHVLCPDFDWASAARGRCACIQSIEEVL